MRPLFSWDTPPAARADEDVGPYTLNDGQRIFAHRCPSRG